MSHPLDSYFSEPGEADLVHCESHHSMAMYPVGEQLDSILTPDYEEDEEMAAARDVVTAELKCFHDLMASGSGCSTPPLVMQPQPFVQARQHQQQQSMYLKQQLSGSSAASPQASCDTAAVGAPVRGPTQAGLWAAQQQAAQYDGFMEAAFQPAEHQYGVCSMYSNASALLPPSVAPCAGPCCQPGGAFGQHLCPQGSSSLSAAGAAVGYGFGSQGVAAAPLNGLYGPPAGSYAAAAAGAGPAGLMIPQGMLSAGMLACSTPTYPSGTVPAAAPAAPASMQQQQQPRSSATNYPPVQGGRVHKRSGSSSSNNKAAAAADALKASTRSRSVDGSCSSKEGRAGTPPMPKAKKGAKSSDADGADTAGAAAAAADTGKAGNASSGRGRTGPAAAAATAAAAAAAGGGSAASIIKEMQQEIEALTASKAQLKTQVRALLTSHTDLLSRVSSLTTKWQQAVAENAALHRQNLQLCANQVL